MPLVICRNLRSIDVGGIMVASESQGMENKSPVVGPSGATLVSGILRLDGPCVACAAVGRRLGTKVACPGELGGPACSLARAEKM